MNDQTSTESLTDAATRVQAHRWDKEGVVCPCCGQLAKVYRRSITRSMAKVLYAMGLHGSATWLDVPTLLRDTSWLRGAASQGGDWAKLAYWGLIERIETERGDGSKRCGIARTTALGMSFLAGQSSVRRWALVYDGDCIGFDGPDVMIFDTLPKGFNYREIL